MGRRLDASRIETRMIPIEAIEDHPRNYNAHPDAQVAQLAESHKEFGQYRTILVWARPGGKYIRVVGHGYSAGARKTGETMLRAEILPEDTPPDVVEAIMLADNLHAQNSSPDQDLLAQLLKEQADAGYDLAALGTDSEMLQQMLAGAGEFVLPEGEEWEEGAGGDDFDTTPEEEGPTRSHVGELWALGEHRLLVGDSCVAENLRQVMQQDKAHMVFTDPPYGVNYTGGTKKWKALDNDQDTSIYHRAIPLLPSIMLGKAAFYCCFAGREAKQVYDAVESAGFEIRALLIWNKNHAQFGAMGAHYKQKHEPLLYCARQGGSLNWYGPNNEVTVWDIPRAAANEYHPTQKPLDLVIRALQNSSQPGDIVFDGFGGSGSTLISCQRTRRKARLIELEPRYADVILARYEAETCKEAELLE